MEENNYKSVINDFKKNFTCGSGGDPHMDKILKNENEADFYKVREYILSKTSRLRVFLILFLKEITWRNELKTTFDIHPSHLEEIFNFFKENNLIVFKPLTEVDNILFECVVKQQSVNFYGQREKVKVYTLTPKGKEYGLNLIDDILNFAQNNFTLQLYVQEIIKKTENHRKTLNNILEEEQNYNNRTITYPDGFVEVRDTLKFKKLNTDIKRATIELKKELLLKKEEQGKLTKQEQGQLAKINNNTYLVELVNENKKNQIINKKNKITYTGKTFHSTHEIIDAMEGVSKEEEKESNKQSKLDAKEKLKRLYAQDTIKYVARGYHNDDEHKEKDNVDECEDFLDNLKGV